MSRRSTRLSGWAVSALVGALLGACAAPPAQPVEVSLAAPETEALVNEHATEGPIDPDAYVGGTPPGYPTEVYAEVVGDPLVVALLESLEERGFGLELNDASRVELLGTAPGQSYRLGSGWLFLHVFAD